MYPTRTTLGGGRGGAVTWFNGGITRWFRALMLQYIWGRRRRGFVVIGAQIAMRVYLVYIYGVKHARQGTMCLYIGR